MKWYFLESKYSLLIFCLSHPMALMLFIPHILFHQTGQSTNTPYFPFVRVIFLWTLNILLSNNATFNGIELFVLELKSLFDWTRQSLSMILEAGHPGQQRMLALLEVAYYWLHIRDDVDDLPFRLCWFLLKLRL